eukprot:2095772-Karenia_brevis.AAC.1
MSDFTQEDYYKFKWVCAKCDMEKKDWKMADVVGKAERHIRGEHWAQVCGRNLGDVYVMLKKLDQMEGEQILQIAEDLISI